MGEACGPWFRDIVYVLFASRDPLTNQRYLRELFALVGKGNSKTTYCAALMLTALFMNVRNLVEFLFVAPTQSIADIAFDAARGMVELDEALLRRFKIMDHKKTIRDKVNGARLRVKTFDLKILTGPKPAGVMIDELHLLGKSIHTVKVLRQIRGGMEKNVDGFVVMITTQSDDVPAGAFRAELTTARAIRDGRQLGRMLPVLYEFPKDVARDEALWSDPSNWHMVMPNLGRSLQLESLAADYRTESRKGAEAKRIWASQHVSIEIGIGLRTDGWEGAAHWKKGEDKSITLERLLGSCDIIVPGLDGGGLDDLYGLTLLGRERETKRWLAWQRAWCYDVVLEKRQSIASRLRDFERAGELTILRPDEVGRDIAEIVELIVMVKDRGLLGPVGVDPAGLGEMIDELAKVGVTVESKAVRGVPQGYAMMNALKTCERKLAGGTLLHCGAAVGAWCVENLKIEPLATAIRATKANAGDAKIDVAMSLFDAATIMATDPAAGPRHQMFFV